MPTFDEVAEEYSIKIKKSLLESGLTKTASLLTESWQRDVFVSNLKEIAVDIERYTANGLPLTNVQKEKIFRLVGKKFGLMDTNVVYGMIKEASNNNFVALANYWAIFRKEAKL